MNKNVYETNNALMAPQTARVSRDYTNNNFATYKKRSPSASNRDLQRDLNVQDTKDYQTRDRNKGYF
jgi:hypothetical protein